VEEALIDQHIPKADQILIGHGHWDHMADIPYIAKKTGAQVIGSETHANVLRASGVTEGKIVQVKGGEFMQFDGYTIEVFPGLHSMGPTKKHAVPGHLYSVPPPPTTVGDMPEGDSLIYLITIGGKFSIFLMSTANFVERAIAGIKPDVALVASIFAKPDPQLHSAALQGAELPEGDPPHALGQLREALLGRAAGLAGDLRRPGESRPLGERGEAGVAQEQDRGDEVLRSLRRVGARGAQPRPVAAGLRL
jgi:hypothetical protein